MPEYLAPGVYVEEVSSGSRAIEGVPTDVAGFVGLAERGPTAPRELSSWEEYLETYGDHVETSYLSRAVEGFFLNGGRRCQVARVVPERSRLQVADYLGDPAAAADRRTGLAALAEIADLALVAVPDQVRREPVDLTPISAAVVEECERLGDRFALISTPAGERDPEATPRPDSSYAALYFPWIEIEDAASGGRLQVPPTGHLAGIYARTALTRGVHAAPANEPVEGAVGLELPVTLEMQDVLNPLGVNCLRDFRASGRGIRVWGARTLGSDPEWRYVAVRRLAIYLERSIERGTQWAVFEPNAEALWSELERRIGDFLADQWRSGALQGTKPDEAFFVHCDRTTMTEQEIEAGRLVWILGFAPLKPAEFVVLRMEKRLAKAR